MKKLAAVVIILFLAVGQITAKTITGIVSEYQGQPLPGVSVLVEGTSRGTVSDFDGKYQIEAVEGSILVFNYVGFTSKKIKVGVAIQYNIALTVDNALL